MIEVVATRRSTCAYCRRPIRLGEIYVESGTYRPRSFHKLCYGRTE